MTSRNKYTLIIQKRSLNTFMYTKQDNCMNSRNLTPEIYRNDDLRFRTHASRLAKRTKRNKRLFIDSQIITGDNLVAY